MIASVTSCCQMPVPFNMSPSCTTAGSASSCLSPAASASLASKSSSGFDFDFFFFFLRAEGSNSPSAAAASSSPSLDFDLEDFFFFLPRAANLRMSVMHRQTPVNYRTISETSSTSLSPSVTPLVSAHSISISL